VCGTGKARFADGYVPSAFFLANEYVRAMGLSGLLEGCEVGEVSQKVASVATRHMDVAAGKLGVECLSKFSSSRRNKDNTWIDGN
jgi:hypothetical protein